MAGLLTSLLVTSHMHPQCTSQLCLYMAVVGISPPPCQILHTSRMRAWALCMHRARACSASGLTGGKNIRLATWAPKVRMTTSVSCMAASCSAIVISAGRTILHTWVEG